MTGRIQSNESQSKMPVPQSYKYERNLSQDIQLQVIVKENESLRRTKTKKSPVLMKKPVTRAQDFTNDNIINVQYGKLKLNQSRDFRIAPQMNNENSCKHVSDVRHHPPMSFLASEKSETKVKCLDSTYFSETICNIMLEKNLDRIWKYLKWPLFLICLCSLIGFITCTYVNSLNTNPLVLKCLNSSTNVDCLVAANKNRSELDINNSTYYDENPLHLSSQSEPQFSNEDVTEAILKGSTTLLRPVIVPQLLHASFREKKNFENGFKNDYTIIERKQNQEYAENKAAKRKQSPYGQEPGEKSKDQAETLNLLGFTSGHQNNFGIPIEEDERVLRLLNEELMKLEQLTEPSSSVSRTESSVIVSPTVPLILHEVPESSTASSGQSDEIQCQSTSLLMCRGILQYDLTSPKAKSLYLSASELKMFEQLFTSNCSARAVEFVCSALEPECRPTQTGNLQPCKRICKSILEACSSLIASSDILTFTFDCDKYPDSDDRNICEDPTRRKDCYENEFKCEDLSCIPSQWQCDNIKDCSDGEDELGCLICNPEEFRCRSNEKCLSDKYRCDMKEDCSDGSDERDCFSENNDDDPQLYPRVFSFASYLLPNFTSENSFTAISDEDRLALGSELNESLASVGESNRFTSESITLDNTQKGDSSNGNVNITRNLANFQDSKEIMMTSDSENKLKISQTINATETNVSHVQVTSPSCVADELRCVSGKCITVDQLCDKVMDCPEGEDELMCTYDERPQPKEP